LSGGISSRPSNSSTSPPAGPARRQPAAAPCCGNRGAGFPRSPGFASLRRLDRRNAHEELDLVGHQETAVGQRLVPLEVEVAAIDHGLEIEADALVAPRVGAALGDITGQLDRL